MKRLLLVIACVIVLTGPAGAFTVTDLILEHAPTVSPAWHTINNTNRWTLGVSINPGGPLINNTDGYTIPTLSEGVYYLYAANLGDPNLSDNPIIWFYLNDFTPTPIFASFHRTGTPGTFNLWTLNYLYDTGWYPVTTAPALYLGWAQGSANLVSHTTPSSGPDTFDDNYLVLGIGVEPTAPVPLPGAVWLLGTGLVGLIGLRRKLKA